MPDGLHAGLLSAVPSPKLVPDLAERLVHRGEASLIPQEFANQQNVGAGITQLRMRRDLRVDCCIKNSG